VRQRRVIGFAAALLLLSTAPGGAAEDRTATAKLAAQKAVEAWLAGVDRGNYGESWDTAASLFQKGGPRETWVTTLQQGRQPLGPAKSRALKSAEYATSIPGAPNGEYVALQFTTTFEKQGPSVEKLVATLENGQWRVLGYRVIPLAAEERAAAAKLAAQKAAKAWLALVDQGAYGESWDALAAASKKEVQREAWTSTLAQVRKPLGQVKSRVQKSAEYTTSLPGAPAGEYVIFQFDTTFENRGPSVETITSALEDGRWRTGGYFVK
jgi:predicted SnoaL-like aldol condensation-catalyzing enzyme